MKKRIRQVFNLLKFMFVYPSAMIFKLIIKNSWMVCEERVEARDNGYWLYKYIRENYPTRIVHFAIDKSSPDYDKLRKLGNVVKFNSLSHWFWYIVSSCNISSQASGRPENAISRFLEKKGIVRTKFCFLQHGVIINDLKWLYAHRNKIDWFLTSAKPEHDFIVEKFGYHKNQVKMLGLPRFDNLHTDISDPKEILLMPTWRTWIKGERCTTMKSAGELPKENFENSEYFNKLNEFVNSPVLNSILKKYDKKLIFYPHRNMQPFLDKFENNNDRVLFKHTKDEDIQVLLRRCSMIITDYSSVFMDIVYMQKPVLFYQFDEAKFRSGQYDQGYFDYHNNLYSLWAGDLDTMLNNLEKVLSGEKTLNYDICDLFPLHDNQNCKRIYDDLSKSFDK